MNRCLLLFLFVFAFHVLSAQGDTFAYSKTGKDVNLNNGKILISFDPYQTTTRGKKERVVQMSTVKYRLVIENGESGKVKTVVSSQDSVLATLFLSGDNRHNILLPDGRMLTRGKVDYDEWSYKDAGQDVVTYAAHKKGKAKNVNSNS